LKAIHLHTPIEHKSCENSSPPASSLTKIPFGTGVKNRKAAQAIITKVIDDNSLYLCFSGSRWQQPKRAQKKKAIEAHKRKEREKKRQTKSKRKGLSFRPKSQSPVLLFLDFWRLSKTLRAFFHKFHTNLGVNSGLAFWKSQKKPYLCVSNCENLIS
jgi:hypothetical protein